MTAFSPPEEQAKLRLLAEHERHGPLPQKQLGKRTLYLSYKNFGPLYRGIGRIVITDFDAALPGNIEEPWSHGIQAYGLQVPEVLIGAPWSYGRNIFGRPGEKTDFARMVACLGEPPRELLERSVRMNDILGADGKINIADVDGDHSFESFVTRMEGDEKAAFLKLIRRMLEWMPEERATAEELLTDPWYEWAFKE